MNHSRILNKRINELHKRALSLTYNDLSSGFSKLLVKDNSVTIHHRNLQTLAHQIFKIKNKLLTGRFPHKKNKFGLRNNTAMQDRSI